MKKFSINIAKAYTLSNWQGIPAHKFFARLELEDTLSQAQAEIELYRLATVYPYPDYDLTLSSSRTVTQSEQLLTSMPPAHLAKKLWSIKSIEEA